MSYIVKMTEKLYISLHLIFLIHLALEGEMCNHPKGGLPNKGTKKIVKHSC